MMGTSGRNGDIAIRRSKDGGSTWTRPEGEEDGILARGVYHTAPVPIVVHEGRLWRAMENRGQGGQRPFLMSAPINSDLLRASSWTFSDELGRGTGFDRNINSWREGNVVVKPDGGLCIIIRVSLKRGHSKAALIEVDDDCIGLSFDPENGYIHFPGGSGKKFTIRYDDATGRYWSVVNPIAPRDLIYLDDHKAGYFRNCLAVSSSRDLEDWKVHHVVEYHPEFDTHAFQYPDWIFDGSDLAVVSRTSYDDGLGGTANRHDSNFMTFHRIEDFGSLSDKNGL
jgi:hypothetical protein